MSHYTSTVATQKQGSHGICLVAQRRNQSVSMSCSTLATHKDNKQMSIVITATATSTATTSIAWASASTFDAVTGTTLIRMLQIKAFILPQSTQFWREPDALIQGLVNSCIGAHLTNCKCRVWNTCVTIGILAQKQISRQKERTVAIE